MLVKEKETVGEILKKLRKDKGLSQEDLAQRSGLPRTYISTLENDRAGTITLPTAQALATGLNVSPTVFFDKEQVAPRPLEELLADIGNKLESLETVEIPLRGIVPAGNPSLEDETREIIVVPRDLIRGASKRVYALRVHGESLSGDNIHSGDIALVDPDASMIIDGKIYALRLENEVVARHLARIDGKVRLSSSHNAYQDLEPNQVEILGRVIASYRYQKLM